ncbi:MAG: DUF1449 family protein [Polyangiales bacterium]
MHPLRAHEWLFAIALAASVLLSVGAVLGAATGDADGDADGDGDGDGDADGAGSSPLPALLSIVGLGRVPVVVGLFGLSALFGASGWLLATVTPSFLPRPIDAWVSVVLASVLAVTVNPVFTRLVASMIPSVETYASSPSERRGRVGVVVLRLSASEGVIRVRHDDGTELRVPVESEEPLPPVGAHVLVVDHDRSRHRDLVVPLPPEALSPPVDPETENHR